MNTPRAAAIERMQNASHFADGFCRDAAGEIVTRVFRIEAKAPAEVRRLPSLETIRSVRVRAKTSRSPIPARTEHFIR